jgi:hypothetical protein
MKALISAGMVIITISASQANTIYLPGEYQLSASDIIVLDSANSERTISYNIDLLVGDQIEFYVRYVNLNALNTPFGDTAVYGEFAVFHNDDLLGNVIDITSGIFNEFSVLLPEAPQSDTIHLRLSLQNDSDPLAFYRPWLRVTDSMPPSGVHDLAVTMELFAGLKLQWTAPGDDSLWGTAALYEIRYSTDSLSSDTTLWWQEAIQAPDPPYPSAEGDTDSLYLVDLDTSTTYYCLLVAYDELGNRSPFSNLAVGTTSRSNVNACLRYDGDQFVEIPFNTSLNPDSQLTIEAWFYLDGSYTWNHATIIDKPAPTHDMPYYQYDLGPANRTDFFAQIAVDGRYNPFEEYGVVEPDVWTHAALVYTGTDRILYLNGTLIDSVADSGQLDNYETSARIGALRNLQDWFFKGLIDELRIWSLARSQSQILEDMHRQLAGDEPGLAAYWNFNEGSGQSVYDLTSSHANGYLGSTAEPDENDPVWVMSTAPIDTLIDRISEDVRTIPPRAFLKQNYPNPFNSATRLAFYLPQSAPLKLEVYDMLGRKVRKLVDDNFAAGQHNITWDGRSDTGELLPSGIYFCHLKSSDNEETRRLLKLK